MRASTNTEMNWILLTFPPSKVLLSMTNESIFNMIADSYAFCGLA